MIELAQHIETLLLDNDCVIIPGFGGFITHYTPAKIDIDNGICLPPCRTIGFNPQLKLNDGLLLQSYMAAYDINFPQALSKVEKEVNALIKTLHEDGYTELPNVGELHYTIHDTYSFTPYTVKFNTTGLYGLDSFEIKPLSELKTVAPIEEKPVRKPYIQPKEEKAPRKPISLHIGKDFIRYTAAVAAAILFFFFLSTPIENTYTEKDNRADLFFSGLFENSEGTSIITSPIAVNSAIEQNQKTTNTAKATKPVVVKEVVVAKAKTEEKPELKNTTPETTEIKTATTQETQSATVNKKFHVIVGSTLDRKKAEELVQTLNNKGFNQAQVLDNGSRLRVCINSYANREDAEKEVTALRNSSEYSDAWLYIHK